MKGKGEKEYPSEYRVPKNRKVRKSSSVKMQEIKENNRTGKTRDLFQKIRDIKGIFHAKVNTIKDRNGMDLTQAEDIKKRWQQYTEEQNQRS